MLRRLPFSPAFLKSSFGALLNRSVSTYSLPDLPYDYGALEPHISGEIMELHHSKHHATYVKNLNTALEKKAEAESKNDIEGVVALNSAIQFNGGGHINHSIFWKNLCPPLQFRPPQGELASAISARFGSLEKFVSEFNTKTAAVQGSGWGWLAFDQESKGLVIMTRANQDPLTIYGKTLVPLLGVDVWEHAYYLQYRNVRPDYLKAIWNVVNWKDVEQRFAAAKA